MKISRVLVLIMATLLMSFTVTADDASGDLEFHMQFKEANELFAQENDPTHALEIYLDILEKRGPSINLLGNIANCYYKLDQLGQARLYLERALLLSPNQPDIRNNYRAVLRALDLPIPETSRFDKIKSLASSNQWFVGAWILFSLPFLVMLARILISGNGRLSEFRNAGFFASVAFAILLGGCFFALSKITARSAGYGIVLSEQSTLKQSPFDQAEDQYSVAEGDKLRIINRHSGYYLCDTPGTEGKGWISESDFQPIANQ